jgi:aminopeptidase N
VCSGLAWYEKFFDVKYPFGKYDQIFVPELNIGAMEHVRSARCDARPLLLLPLLPPSLTILCCLCCVQPGCVTFTDDYVYRDPPTNAVLGRRCDTVLHEMAHMWFGDLVTMKWWDGLWLNESFATYMAAMCVAEATDFGAVSWSNFNSSYTYGAHLSRASAHSVCPRPALRAI